MCVVSKVSLRESAGVLCVCFVQAPVAQCQKRPTTLSKETYYSVKRDLLLVQAPVAQASRADFVDKACLHRRHGMCGKGVVFGHEAARAKFLSRCHLTPTHAPTHMFKPGHVRRSGDALEKAKQRLSGHEHFIVLLITCPLRRVDGCVGRVQGGLVGGVLPTF